MSRALLSEACERDESWRCLPSGLRTATTGGVLWKECVLGRLVLIRLQRKAKRLNQGEIREGIGGGRKKWYNMGIK